MSGVEHAPDAAPAEEFVLAPSAPIGVFDSGLGGLTVARQLMRVLPQERIVYVADQIHVPYGGRDLTEICGFACGISEALVRYGCKAVVMACNISSATGLLHVQGEYPHLPVLGVIEPGARQAVRITKNGRIGVLTTEGTKRSGAYTRTLLALDTDLQVSEVACPDFVPLVESEQEDTTVAAEAARRYLTPLQAAGVDTVVLGCTHYPFLLPLLQRVAPHITFVDPATTAIDALQQTLHSHDLLAATPTTSHLLTTSGDLSVFTHQLARFLPTAAHHAHVAPAVWKQGTLHLPSK